MNIFKKILFLQFVLLLCFNNDSKAQGFTFTPLNSSNVQLPFIPDSTQVIQIQGIVSNTSSAPINFRFARIQNNLPAGWETQMCYDLCYAPFIDTISLPDDPPYTIQPNHTDTLFYIDFTTNGKGLGTSVVRMFNTDNPAEYVENTFTVEIGGVGINNISSVAETFSLSQNYPNPFNPTTNINFSIPKSGNVSLKVYDILGNEVSDLINNENLSAGKYKVDFNGSNLSSGIYYYTIKADNFIDTKKMLLIK